MVSESSDKEMSKQQILWSREMLKVIRTTICGEDKYFEMGFEEREGETNEKKRDLNMMMEARPAVTLFLPIKS